MLDFTKYSLEKKDPIVESQKKLAQHPEKKFPKLLCSQNPLPLEDLQSEEEKLLKQLEEIQQKKKQLEEEKKRRTPEIITFKSYQRGMVTFTLTHDNPSVIELIKKYKGLHNTSHTSFYTENEFFAFKEETETTLPKTEFKNFTQMLQPFWIVTRREKELVVQWNPTTNPDGYYKLLQRYNENNQLESLTQIPGARKLVKHYTIPLNEGWRLYSIQPELETRLLKWESHELLDEVQTEFNKRLRIKTIHTAEDSDVDVTFTHLPTFKNRAHQRVAHEFTDLVDHKSLIAYGTGTGKTAIAIGASIRTQSERNLVIVPGSLRKNWERHIENHTGIKPITLAGRVPTQFDFKTILTQKPEWLIINYEILRTSFKKKEGLIEEQVFPWVELLNLYMPTYVFVDESHYIGTPSSSQSKAVRRIEAPKKMALSGTPIKNRPGEMWAVLNWLYPDQFPYYETFLNQYGFGRSIGTHEAGKLRSLLETIMLKRSRQDISKNLPPVNRIVENFELRGTKTLDKARRIYDRILLGIYEELSHFDPEGIGGQTRTFKHILPKLNAMIKVCAAAKVEITVNRAIEIADSIEEEKWNGVLIFTHFQGTCNTIARHLGNEALSFIERRANKFHLVDMSERMKIVDEFQTNPQKKFLVATEGSAREGLDITKAGVVIFNDLFWNPARHIQCEGRPFYRESDMHGGDSYYLQFEDTIEDWLTELQGIKQNTIDKIVEGKGIEDSITHAIVARLREMFEKRTKGGL